MQVRTTTKTLLATSISTVLLSGCYWDDPQWVANKVSQSISRSDVVDHLQTLEGIASPTPDGTSLTRAAGSQGYQESVDYIIATMKELGYEVTTQEFDFRSWTELGGTKLNVASVDLISAKQAPEGTEGDFSVLSYAGSSNGELTGELVFITPDFDFSSPNYDGSDGCEASDFTGIDLQGKIAVIQRGTCGFSDKVVNAQKAGAKAVIVFNQGNSAGRTGLFSGTLSNTSTATIPAFGVTFQLGKNWFDAAQSAAIPVTLTLNVDDKMIVTQNVLAETRKGNPDQIVMLGAHLDSVPEGPGINDNGSGTAGLLEYAEKLAKLKVPVKNKVRFAWWAAEEAGLVGSNHYTKTLFEPIYQQAQQQIMDELGISDPAQLTEAQKDLVEARYTQLNKIKLYLNFDMIGSPNYIFGVMDGDLSDTKDSPDNAYTGDFKPPFGTSDIELRFNQFFTDKGEGTIPQALSKRSDYAGFADWGVAFGGLFTGAEKTKTAEEVVKFGGEIDVAYDHCYHQACDDLNNISQKALYVNTQALAYVTTYYAMSKTLFPAEVSAQPKTMAKQSFRIQPVEKHRIGTTLKAAHSESDHGHFHGDFDQEKF